MVACDRCRRMPYQRQLTFVRSATKRLTVAQRRCVEGDLAASRVVRRWMQAVPPRCASGAAHQPQGRTAARRYITYGWPLAFNRQRRSNLQKNPLTPVIVVNPPDELLALLTSAPTAGEGGRPLWVPAVGKSQKMRFEQLFSAGDVPCKRSIVIVLG